METVAPLSIITISPSITQDNMRSLVSQYAGKRNTLSQTIKIDGHNNTNLQDMPGVKAICQSLYETGLVAILDPLNDFPNCLGPLEIWALARGIYPRNGKVRLSASNLVQYEQDYDGAKDACTETIEIYRNCYTFNPTRRAK